MDGCVSLGCFIRKRNLLAHLTIWTIVAFVLIAALTVFKQTIIGIFYTIFFLNFVLIFQCSHSLWARTIRVYCVLLIAFSSVITLLTYTFQFSGVEKFFKDVLSDQVLNDIGLNVKTQGWMVFLEPFTSLIITISLVLYLKVFDNDFTRFAYLAEEVDTSLSAPLNTNQVASQNTINDSSFIMLMDTNPTAGPSERIDQPLSTTDLSQLEQSPPSVSASRSDLRRASRRSAIKNFINSATECLWRLAETHFIKLVVFMIFRIPIVDVCFLNFPFIVIVTLALRYPYAEKCLCLVASWLISFIMVARNLSNLASLKAVDITETCEAGSPAPLVGNTYSLLQYIGLNLSRVDHYVLVLILITIYFFIRIHYERRSEKTYELSFGVIFTGVGEREADMGCLNMIKYFCNFGFYKFGIELTCLALIITIANRLDSMAALYGIILTLISVTTSKRFLASVWPIINIIVCLLVVFQYILRLGFPESFCRPYPWELWPDDIKHWLYLSDYTMVQDANLLLFDFLALLAICRQSVVFQQMTLATSSSQMHHSLSAEKFRSRYLPNEDEFAAEDCFTNYTNQNNYLKSIFFVSIYWITLAVVLVAGATKISLFSLGYLVGCFIFLWLGNDTYLLPLPSIICRWNYFISYAGIVIFTKVIMQIFSCYYHEQLMGRCYILQLSRVVCYRKIHNIPANDPAFACVSTLPTEELDILWDGLCLMFLMMQRIVFGSRYFGYLVKEVRAQQILASRGAELILATRIEEAKAQGSYEKGVMRNIREKMESLKSDNELTSKAWQRLITLPHHHQVIRNADKHLFSSLSDEPASQSRTEGQYSGSSFIPDPTGDELQRMADINGISAVFTRWMKREPLYGSASSQSPTAQKSTDLSEADGPEEGRGCWEMINLITYSCLLSATVKLNRLSRSYRYVSRRMAAEKNILKRDFNPGDVRFRSDPTWRRMVIGSVSESYSNEGEHLNNSLHRIRSALKIIASRAGSSRDSNQSMDTSPHDRSPNNGPSGQEVRSHGRVNGSGGSGSGGSNGNDKAELEDPELQFLKLNMFSQFCRALAYVFISNTSLLCQLVIVLNQVLTASLLSLPLPLLTFLWGTLSVPRPTKRFWKTVITYTEIVIVIKYIFQFPLWNWQPSNINPFYYPNLLGIKNITIVYDLLLLLALFFHRSMLKSLGQWDATLEGKKSDEFEPESKYDSIRSTSPRSGGQSYPQSGMISSSRSIDGHKESPSPPRLDGYQDYPGSHQVSYQNEIQDSIADLDENEDAQMRNCGCSGCFNKAYIRTKRSITLFFRHVLGTPYKVQTDVYTWMFLCDFINFLILIYGFWAFGGGYANQTVASFLNENRIPFSVLIMLLAQFGSIIIDRAFYLQKNIAGKLMFQVVLVIGIHFWLFFALPFTTGHALTLKEYWPPKAWYVFKCIYFLLSAHQIRCGYPRRVLGNCFTRGYGYANWISFKVYRAIPLVYDLRLYMDWIWTETTLEFRNWSIMEDMFANLFIRKCELCIEEEFPQPRAKPLRRINKYLTGGAFIVLILAIIWGPLFLFSMGKTVGESNLPVEMEYELEFVGFQPIIRMRATTQQIEPINENQYTLLKARFVSQGSQSFLGDYKVGDVALIRLDGQSNAVWEISPPSKELLMTSIINNQTLTLKSTWTFFRIKKEKSQNFDVSIAGSYQHILHENSSLNFRSSLYDMLADSSTTLTPPDQAKFVVTPPIFPNFLRVPETGQVSPVEQFEDSLFEYNKLRPLNLTYIRMFDTIAQQTSNSTSWWRAEDLCKYQPANDSYLFWHNMVVPHCDSLVVVTFNDRIFTGILALLSAPGIIGLYTTFVVFFARLIRTEPAGRVIYTEIPKVDRVYGLIMDIYMMRECKEFELEEKLFAKLLFLYRSPEMLIEWSKREDDAQYLEQPQQQQINFNN